MATQAAAYRNSDDSGSQKERHFFSRAELENLFEICDLPRRFHNLILGAWIAAGKPFGSEILLFKAVEDYRRACRYKSERTVRYNLRAAEKLGLLEVASPHHAWIRERSMKDRGLYRSVTTHRLPIDLLLQWRKMHRNEVVTIPAKPPESAPPPRPPVPAAPLPAVPMKPAAERHRSNGGSRAEDRLRKLRQEIAATMTEFMVGHAHHIERVGGYGYDLKPSDPRYRPKMSQDEAILATAKECGISPDEVREHLKIVQFKPEDEDKSP